MARRVREAGTPPGTPCFGCPARQAMGMGSAQTFSHFPTWPLPIAGVERVTISDRQPCGYLPGRVSTFRAFEVSETDALGTGTGMTGQEYQRLMDAGFRRSGTIIYQPMLARCRACVPIRVPVTGFAPSRSQRRVLRMKKDLVVQVQRPEPTREKWEMYESYQRQWHAKKMGDEDIASFVQFLYRSPVERWNLSTATAGANCWPSESAIYARRASAASIFILTRAARRSPGDLWGALYEIEWAREMNVKYWYAGYWIRECPSMAYKSRFSPARHWGPMASGGRWRNPDKTLRPYARVRRESGREPDSTSRRPSFVTIMQTPVWPGIHTAGHHSPPALVQPGTPWKRSLEFHEMR